MTTSTEPSIRCGNCKKLHHSVAAVRACHQQPKTTGQLTLLVPVQRTYRRVEVPEGRYAIQRLGSIRFYQVDKPTQGRWAGHTFVTRLAGQEEYPIKNPRDRDQILVEIGKDVQAAAARYNAEIDEPARS